MTRSSRRIIWVSLCLLVAASAGVALVWIMGTPPSVATTQPATEKSSPPPAPVAVEKTVSIQTYGQVLHADLRNYPVTQPWAFGVDLSDAAHIILPDEVYVCPRGDLWIVRAGADPLQQVLARAARENEHVIDRPVQYIVWTLDKKGVWRAAAICRNAQGADELVDEKSTQLIPGGDHLWDMATDWNDEGTTRLLVPTHVGIDIITPGSEITINACDLRNQAGPAVRGTAAATPARGSIAQIVFDMRGILAWLPADEYSAPANRVARFIDGKWTYLDSADWPGDSIIHLVPMLDGTVLQIRRSNQAGIVDLKVIPLDSAKIDEEKVSQLAAQLNDDDPDKRVAASAALSEFGPGIFPILEKLLPEAAPEESARIKQILEGKLSTKLGGMLINGNQLTVRSRLASGGVLFFAPEGITIPQGQDEPRIVKPAYLVIRPGRPVQEAMGELIPEIQPDTAFQAIHDEWILTTPDKGPQRFLPPSQLDPLLKDSEKRFSQLTAIDGRGRWIFRAPPADAATQPSDAATRMADSPARAADSATRGAQASAAGPAQTLIIDPTVPDPTNRLAIWLIDVGTDVGWNNEGWPAIAKDPSQWILNSHDWQQLDDSKDKFATDPPPPGAPSTLPAAQADATAAATQQTVATMNASPAPAIASTAPAAQPAAVAAENHNGPLLMIDAAGNYFYDGQTTLTVVAKSGARRVWTLPASIGGSDDFKAWMVADRDGKLFLFNSLGRIVHLTYTPGAAEPFEIEAIFDKDVPFFKDIRRAWLDPAGRIAVAYDSMHLAIVFPSGQIPREISNQILMQDIRRPEAP